MPAASRPVPKHICQHALFPSLVQDYVDATKLFSPPMLFAWATYKVALRVWPMGPGWDETGPNLVEWGKCPKLAELRPTSDEIGSTLATCGQVRAEVCRNRSKLARIRPNLA